MKKKTQKFRKLTAIALISAMLITLIWTPTPARAANITTPEQAMTWVKSKEGVQVGAGQCVSLVAQYIRELGGAPPSVNYASQYSTCAVPSGFTRYSKSQSSPQKGDILIWTTKNNGTPGHVAIYESDYSAWHQNVSGYQKVKHLTYYYTLESWDPNLSYWGVLRPNWTTPPDPCVENNCYSITPTTYICTATDGLSINSGHNYSSPTGVVIPYNALVQVTKLSSSKTYAHVTYNGTSGIASINYLKPYNPVDECVTYNCVADYAGYYKVSGTDGALVLHNAHNYNDSSKIGEISEGTIVWVTKGSTTKTYRHITYGSQQGILSGNYLSKLASYTLSLNANGGSVSRSSFKVWKEVGDFSNLSEYLPSRSGYTFLGWYTSASGGVQVYNASGRCTNEGTYWRNGVWNYDGNVTLYAHWQQNTVYVDEIGLTADETISIGESKTLTATIYPSNATNKNVSWSSSNTSVVSVSNGTITGVKEGTAQITVTATDRNQVRAYCTVVVKPTITGLTLNRSSLVLSSEGLGSYYPLEAEKTPADGKGTIQWKTTSSSIANVDGYGLVHAGSAGTASVSAYVVNGPSAGCEVIVMDDMPLMSLPADLQIIEEQAFLNTEAVRIEIPSGVKSIGERAFANSSTLRYIYVPSSVISIAYTAFDNDPNLCIVCDPGSAAEQYAKNRGIPCVAISMQ